MSSKPERPEPEPSVSWRRAIAGALRGEEHDYTTGPLSRGILLLAIPMVLEMAMESVFALCDALFVKELGDAALATVGLTEAMLTIVYAVAIGLAMAATALVARRVGEKDIPRAVRAATQAVIVGAVLGVLLGVPCALYGGDLLGLMGASDAVLGQGSAYASIVLGTNVVVMLLFLNNAVFRGAGDPALAMRALIVANGVNLILDPCLIFGLGPFPELGLTGAAIATTIGRGVGVVYQLRMLRRGSGRVALRGPFARFHAGDMLEMLRTSVGGVGQFLVATASWVVLVRIVAPFGDAALAGYQVAIRVIMFTILPAFGLSNAAATLVGQNLGAGRPDRAVRAVWLTGYYTMAFLGTVAVVFYTAAPWILEPFVVRAADPETMHRVGVDCLRIISLGYLFYAWGMVMMQAFNGAGRTMIPTWMNVFCFWLVEIPLAWALAHGAGLGPNGVFWSVAVAESLLAVVGIVVFRSVRWK